MADKTITAVVGATGTQVENHNAEDKRIVEMNQAGVNSRLLEPGSYSLQETYASRFVDCLEELSADMAALKYGSAMTLNLRHVDFFLTNEEATTRVPCHARGYRHVRKPSRKFDRVLKYNSRGAGLTVWEFTFGTGVPPHDSILVGTPPRWIVFGPCAVTHNRRTRKHVSNHR